MTYGCPWMKARKPKKCGDLARVTGENWLGNFRTLALTLSITTIRLAHKIYFRSRQTKDLTTTRKYTLHQSEAAAYTSKNTPELLVSYLAATLDKPSCHALCTSKMASTTPSSLRSIINKPSNAMSPSSLTALQANPGFPLSLQRRLRPLHFFPATRPTP